MGEKRGTKGLELWCKKICQNYDSKGVSVTNMTSSFRNGLAFCAIIHHFRPDLIDFDKLNKDDIYNNCDLAFSVAEKYLNIPALLDPADMVQFEVPDRLSVLTYLSQYYQVFGAQDASSSKKTPPKDDSKQDDAKSSTSKSPLQMAAELNYGVPKREPCTICNFPIFLAERFKIGRRLYHRTCLKCVHCKNQLTPTDLEDLDETANIVGEFTCETCQNRIINESLAPIKETDSIFDGVANGDGDSDDDDVRYGQLNSDFDSLAAEIDDFPQQSNVLKRSLSDEEKSKNLHSSSSKKSFSAMNDFLSAQYVDEAPIQAQVTAGTVADVVVEVAQSKDHESEVVDTPLPSKEVVEITSTKSNEPLSPVEPVLGAKEDKSDDECLENDENVAPEINVHTHPTSSNTEVPTTTVENAPKPLEDAPEEEEEESSEEEEDEDEETESSSENESEPPDTTEVSAYTKASTLQLPTRGGSRKPETAGYPVDLNPFGEDEENEATAKPTPKKGMNPFGSDSEDDEVPAMGQFSRPSLPKVTVSTNPFDSDDDETEQPIVPKKTPVPTPRKMLQPFNDTGSSFSSLPHLDASSERSSFRGSNYSLNSNNSSTSTTPRRLKGKAPPPPPLTSTPSNVSPVKTQSRPRKSRPAPAPPVDRMDQLTLSTTSLASTSSEASSTTKVKKLIPLDSSLIEENRSEIRPVESVMTNVYRRHITPLSTDETSQLEKIKDNKDAKNRDRQSGSFNGAIQISSDISSSMGKPRAPAHRKGAAPMPVPPKRILQMLPLQEIRHELEVIEVQHLGLEKQGVTLEKMIRERCEEQQDNQVEVDLPNSIDVDDLIMQLFEIVNEKNELFRRQAELMYLRRSHRLEQEQADLEHEIRKLMAQPERNQTDSDKTREENLIARLVEVVQQRNEIIECLEMDRVRERDEDTSIQHEKEKHAAKRDEVFSKQTLIKLSKKEKKSQKESKKFFLRSNKKVDTEKETDESELAKATKKKKKKFLF